PPGDADRSGPRPEARFGYRLSTWRPRGARPARDQADFEPDPGPIVARTLIPLMWRRFSQNSWFSPPKTSLTEPSVKIWRIELVSRSAHDRTRTLSGAPGG